MKKIRRRLNVLKAPVCVMDSEKVILSPKRCFRPGRHSRSWLDAVKLSAGSLKASCADEDHADECGLYSCDTSTYERNGTQWISDNIINTGPSDRDVYHNYYALWIQVSVDTSDDYCWYFTLAYATEHYTHVDHQTYSILTGWTTSSTTPGSPNSNKTLWSYYGEVTVAAYYDVNFDLNVDYDSGDDTGGSVGGLSIYPTFSHSGPNITMGATADYDIAPASISKSLTYSIFYAEC